MLCSERGARKLLSENDCSNLERSRQALQTVKDGEKLKKDGEKLKEDGEKLKEKRSFQNNEED